MSTAFRITQRSVSTTMLQGLQSNQSKLQKIQEQLSSGKQISRPSDSPVKTVETMQFRSELRRTEQHIRNADDGLGLLATADTALTGSLDMTRRVRDLTLRAINGSVNAVGREAIAAEIDTIREGLVGVANLRYLDRPVFGGTTPGTVAYSARTPADPGTGTGEVYRGDAGAISRTVAAGTEVEVNMTGPQVFGSGEDQLFDVLASLSATLRGPEAALGDLDTGLTKLDTATNRIISALGTIGARTNRMETMLTRAKDSLISLTNNLNEVESIDLPRTIVDLQMQEVAYKAALGATARVVQPSLLDFLR
jgi:flagellar hook-associated protein 3 FlgL